MAVIYIALLILSCLLVYSIVKKTLLLAGIPGPKRLPFFGNILQLKGALHLQLSEWAKKYGPVFALDLAGTPVVVVSGKEALYEILVKQGHEFAGRVQSFRTNQTCFGGYSDYTTVLKHQKKMVLSHVKSFGPGMEKLEMVIMKEMERLINQLAELCDNGKAVIQLDEYIDNCVTTISAIILLGHEVDEDDINGMLKFMVCFDNAFGTGPLGQLLDAFPFLRHLGHPSWKSLKNLKQHTETLYQKWKKRIQRGKIQCKDLSDNLLHNYLEAYNNGQNEIGITEDHCRWFIPTIYGGALATTKSTMNILISNLICHPHIQKKLREESDGTLNGRRVTVKDRYVMPYHHAVILEITRLCPPAPQMIPHRSRCDTRVSGFRIPKDTMIFANIWALMHDENIWDEPLQFKPERYIDDDDGKLVPADHPSRVNHLAFSAGPRVCPGETMATARLFLILATLIQHFELLPATSIDNQPPCSCNDMIPGFFIAPLRYEARLKPRK